MESAMTRFWTNGYIQRIDICEIHVDNSQTVTHQTHTNYNYPYKYEAIVIA